MTKAERLAKANPNCPRCEGKGEWYLVTTSHEGNTTSAWVMCSCTKQMPRCTVCGQSARARVHKLAGTVRAASGHEFSPVSVECNVCEGRSGPGGCSYCKDKWQALRPKVERKPRLTIHVTRWMHDCYWTVNLDGKLIASGATLNNREPEARAAAQAYVDELLAHFRGGGE